VDVAALLRGSELFQALDDEALGQVVARTTTQTLQRGDVLFREGDPGDRMYVVERGRIAISKRSPDAKESIVALMEASDLFGDMCLFDGEPRSAGARALEPSDVLVVPYAPLTEVLEERPHLLWHIVRLLSRRMRVTDAALADSMFLDVTGRTAKRLLELSAGADEFALPITQEELAGMVGASRERVNKALAQFIRLGWLRVADRRYRIVKRDELARRAR
jgi:CRP-like cAMP-binding protein